MANFSFNLNGKDVQITATAEGWNHSGRWGHSATLAIDGTTVSTASIRYHNRTWEGYPYQTVLHNVVWDYIARLESQDIDAYKRRNRLERLPRGARKSFDLFWASVRYNICAQIDAQHNTNRFRIF